MAIATNGGHVSRALDFYKTEGKYFIIGGTEPWRDESTPTPPSLHDYKMNDVVALKKVYNTFLVVPDENGTIEYRTQNWKKVSEPFSTRISSSGVSINSKVIPVESLAGIVEGVKLRINNYYEGRVQSISGLNITLDTPAPVEIPAGSIVEGGAYVEEAKYVYIDAYLNYDEFPIVRYRQIGLCTGVTPNTEETLRAARYSTTGVDEYSSLGVLEVLDNRVPSTRDIDQRELLSLIIEF